MIDFSKYAESCIKCGKCVPNCTIHLINPEEVTSPRGFLELLGAYKRGELELDKELKKIFESCFLCATCVNICPNSLPTDTLIEEVRYEIARKFGIKWYKKVFFWLLKHRRAMDLFAKFGYVFMFFYHRKGEFWINKNIILGKKNKRVFPLISKKSFLNSYPQSINKGKKKKVAIFIGCVANYSFTKVGDGLIKILKFLDYGILIPKKQLCCGAPAYFTGDFETVFYLIKKNIEYFENFIDEVEAILVPEATCSAMIIHDWEIFLKNRKDENLLKRAKKIISKTYIATKWLFEKTSLLEKLAQREIKIDALVTYHDPCHARKVQNVSREPREFLKKIYNFKEMEEPDRCCGFGGVTIQSERYDLAKKAGKAKAEFIRKSKAKIVATECSACKIQLSNSLFAEQVDAEVLNPIELIARAI